MQRIALPMIGGMISSMLLTLIVIPAIFGLVKGRGLPLGATLAAQDAANGTRVRQAAESRSEVCGCSSA